MSSTYFYRINEWGTCSDKCPHGRTCKIGSVSCQACESLLFHDREVRKVVCKKETTTIIRDFSVYERNENHWDVYTKDVGRIFKIRGTVGNFIVVDTRNSKPNVPHEQIEFKTVQECMQYICNELMFS